LGLDQTRPNTSNSSYKPNSSNNSNLAKKIQEQPVNDLPKIVKTQNFTSIEQPHNTISFGQNYKKSPEVTSKIKDKLNGDILKFPEDSEEDLLESENKMKGIWLYKMMGIKLKKQRRGSYRISGGKSTMQVGFMDPVFFKKGN
jgi:hypothetical protein